MAFLGFMTVREHEAVVAGLKATHTGRLASLEQDLLDDTAAFTRLAREKVGFLRLIGSLESELATLKAERERRLAPLAAANAARKAKAQAARGGDVREGV